MATRPTVSPISSSTASSNARRKKRASEEDPNVRYFLLKPGSSLEKPELGEEITNIKRALVQSFRTGQPYLAVTAWKGVEDISEESGNSPAIVKQAVSRP